MNALDRILGPFFILLTIAASFFLLGLVCGCTWWMITLGWGIVQ